MKTPLCTKRPWAGTPPKSDNWIMGHMASNRFLLVILESIINVKKIGYIK